MTKLLLTCSLLVSAGIANANYEVCIFAKYMEGQMKAVRHSDFPTRDGYQISKVEKLGAKAASYSPIDLSGHAGIFLRTNKKITRSYGYYPDEENLGVNWESISKEDLKPHKMGKYDIKPMAAELCVPISFRGLEKIERLAKNYEKKYGSWGNINNCTRFASVIFYKMTGIKMKHGLPFPRRLYKEIMKKNGQKILTERIIESNPVNSDFDDSDQLTVVH